LKSKGVAHCGSRPFDVRPFAIEMNATGERLSADTIALQSNADKNRTFQLTVRQLHRGRPFNFLSK
jgi:hypothetical protein